MSDLVLICFASAAFFAVLSGIYAIQGHQSPQSMVGKDQFIRALWRTYRIGMFLCGAVAGASLVLAIGLTIAGAF